MDNVLGYYQSANNLMVTSALGQGYKRLVPMSQIVLILYFQLTS